MEIGKVHFDIIPGQLHLDIPRY